MSQPTPYQREFSFTSHSVSNPTTPQPGQKLDIEFDALELTIDETLANLALIQDDNGNLRAGSVGIDQISGALSNYLIQQLAAQMESSGAVVSLRQSDTFTGDGSQVNFTLSLAVPNKSAALVYVDGRKQILTAYGISATTLTFTTAPPNGAPIEVEHLNAPNAYTDSFVGNGTVTVFTLSRAVAAQPWSQVYIDGTYQHPGAYSIAGTTITFSSAPPVGAPIEVVHFREFPVTSDLLIALAGLNCKPANGCC